MHQVRSGTVTTNTPRTEPHHLTKRKTKEMTSVTDRTAPSGVSLSFVVTLLISSVTLLSTPSDGFGLNHRVSASRIRSPLSLSQSQSSSSSASDVSLDDDEALNRLRKKREEIMAKKKLSVNSSSGSSEKSATKPASENPNPAQSTLPPRPISFKAKSNEKESKKKSKPKSSYEDEKNKFLGVDYSANYEDENELHIPNRIGICTVAWGDTKLGFVNDSSRRLKKKEKKMGKFLAGDLQVAYDTLLSNGISFIDTSQLYGASLRSSQLSSEQILGRFGEEAPSASSQPILATKYTNPVQALFFGKRYILKALESSCKRMETSCVELYQLRANLFTVFNKGALADGLAVALDRGSCNYVGVVNVKPRGLRSFSKLLEKRGVSLTSNQFSFSLTNRKALKDGTIQACKDLGIIPLASDPLDDDLASGLYTANNPTGGGSATTLKYSFRKVLEPLIPLHDAQLRVAEKVNARLKKQAREQQRNVKARYRPQGEDKATNITPKQVAINYVVAKGAVPLPNVNTVQQAEEILGCLGWELTEEEVTILDDAADMAGR